MRKPAIRVLDDDEIRRVWTACEALGNYGALIRMLLLTTQRLDKVLTMAWADIDADGVWRIPNVSKREKPHGGELKLPQLARDLLAALPVLEGNPYVFAGRGQGHTNGHSKNKARLDRASGVTGWVVHDLRRTARSLMARAGVRPDIAERVLGHVQRGVRRRLRSSPLSRRESGRAGEAGGADRCYRRSRLVAGRQLALV